MKSPIVLLQSLLIGIKRLEPDVKGLDRDLLTIQARFEHEGYGFLSVSLPTLCDALDQGLSLGKFACPTGFSRSRKGALPKLFSGLLCEVFDPTTGSLKQAPRVGAIKCLREALRLFKKVQLGSVREEDLHTEACRTFWDTDKELEGLSFPPALVSMLSCVSGYVLGSITTSEINGIHPKHGPGAVYEKCTPNNKWAFAAENILGNTGNFLQSSFYRLDGFLCSRWTETSLLNEGDKHQFPHHEEIGEPKSDGSEARSHEQSSGDIAKLISVEKNATSRRTITVEPLMNMFIQQGLNTLLRQRISKCGVLRHSLALTDQSENQKLALEGSRTGNWATLDLSAASDRLSLRLVELVFAQNSAFLSAMLECRSKKVHEVGKPPQEILKFAGMGNALTFPVQSTVFALIAMAAILSFDGVSRPSGRALRRVARCVRVYGDDIIVPSVYAHQVMTWLESFGLKVNRKKSFTVGNFRESCGLDAWGGYDCTPFYIKDRPDNPEMEPSAIAGFVALSNHSWLKGHYEFATELKSLVEGTLKRYLPLVGRSSGALGWHSRVDACHANKWDDKLQRLVFRAPVLKAPLRRDKIDGEAALLKFFLTPLIERFPKHLKVSIKRFEPRLAWHYHPTQVGVMNI